MQEKEHNARFDASTREKATEKYNWNNDALRCRHHCLIALRITLKLRNGTEQ